MEVKVYRRIQIFNGERSGAIYELEKGREVIDSKRTTSALRKSRRQRKPGKEIAQEIADAIAHSQPEHSPECRTRKILIRTG
jgi:hypothetical protein